jgi:hypothetical protein
MLITTQTFPLAVQISTPCTVSFTTSQKMKPHLIQFASRSGQLVHNGDERSPSVGIQQRIYSSLWYFILRNSLDLPLPETTLKFGESRHFRIFHLLFSYSKNKRLQYIKLQLCLFFCMKVKFGLSLESKKTGWWSSTRVLRKSIECLLLCAHRAFLLFISYCLYQ